MTPMLRVVRAAPGGRGTFKGKDYSEVACVSVLRVEKQRERNLTLKRPQPYT